MIVELSTCSVVRVYSDYQVLPDYSFVGVRTASGAKWVQTNTTPVLHNYIYFVSYSTSSSSCLTYK